MPSRVLIPFALAICLAPAATIAAERPVSSNCSPRRAVSSCPPANAYLNRWSAIAATCWRWRFHVTYWDRLGWKDPFSLEAATERRAATAIAFGDGSIRQRSSSMAWFGHMWARIAPSGPAIEQAKRQGQTAAVVDIKSRAISFRSMSAAAAASGGSC